MDIINISEHIFHDMEEKLRKAITKHLGEGWTFEDLEKRNVECKVFHNGQRDYYIDGICIFSYRMEFKL